MPQLSFDLLFDQSIYIAIVCLVLSTGLTSVLDTPILLRGLYSSSLTNRRMLFISHFISG